MSIHVVSPAFVAQSGKKNRPRKPRRDAPALFLATDSEWDTSRPEPWLSTVIAGADLGTVLYVTEDIPPDARTAMEATAREEGGIIEFVRRDDSTSLLVRFKERFHLIGMEVFLLMFYSPKDIEYALGAGRFLQACDEGKVRQNNNLSGEVLDGDGAKVYIKDLKGWAGNAQGGGGSLKAMLAALGITTEVKSLIDPEDKARMYSVLVNRPADFVRYSAGDGTQLLTLHDRFLTYIRDIQVNDLDMTEDDLWTKTEIPMTMGSLDAKTFERWIHGNATDKTLFKFCLRKLGVLDENVSSKRLWASRKAFRECMGYRTRDRFLAAVDAKDESLTTFLGSKYFSTAMSAASVKTFASRGQSNSVIYGALVHGGRCANENPYNRTIAKGLDIDISGCYGAALRAYAFPIGLPTTWGRTPNEKPITFGDWLDKNRSGLVPGLWMATVSGKLAFHQDLIFSKMSTPGEIRKAVQSLDGDGDDSDIQSDFAMLRMQVENGIITSDILTTLEAVATSAEWAGIRALQVVTASAYLNRDRHDGMDDWCESVLASRGEYRNLRGETKDERSRAWFAIPLEGFIGKLADRRKDAKRLIAEAPTQEERDNAKTRSNMLKDLINVMYGAITSRHFTISNSVLANNITARARVGVWMMAKALGCQQIITDGGAYDPAKVRHFDPTSKKPGLDVLSRGWEWHAPNRKRWVRPMVGFDWSLPVSEWLDTRGCDVLATEHIRRFWEPFKIPFAFQVEHKVAFTDGAFSAKADYRFLCRGDDRPTFRTRGVRKADTTHPRLVILDRISEGSDVFPTRLDYLKGGILKVGKYRVIQNSKGYADLKTLRPGDNLPETTHVQRFNNNQFPMDTVEDYLRVQGRMRLVDGVAKPLFERFASQGIEAVFTHMETDNLRDGTP